MRGFKTGGSGDYGKEIIFYFNIAHIVHFDYICSAKL